MKEWSIKLDKVDNGYWLTYVFTDPNDNTNDRQIKKSFDSMNDSTEDLETFLAADDIV